MFEVIFAGAVLAITLRWIGRSMRDRDGFARHFSRGAYMRDLNRALEKQ
jgi:hypothetical protein